MSSDDPSSRVFPVGLDLATIIASGDFSIATIISEMNQVQVAARRACLNDGNTRDPMVNDLMGVTRDNGIHHTMFAPPLCPNSAL